MDQQKIEEIFIQFQGICNEVIYKNDFTIDIKNDNTYVTTADLQVQEKYIQIIREDFPDHRIIHEENENCFLKTNSEYTWVIDPIDGTANFINGKKEFSSSVGLMYHADFIAAFVYFPKLNKKYVGLSSKGVFYNDEQFHISEKTAANELILCSKTIKAHKDKLKDLYDVHFYYCATYSLLRVLEKDAVAYIIINTKLYDVGPMSYILQLAGIETINEKNKLLQYQPTLELIPFLLATNNKKISESLIEILFPQK